MLSQQHLALFNLQLRSIACANSVVEAVGEALSSPVKLRHSCGASLVPTPPLG